METTTTLERAPSIQLSAKEEREYCLGDALLEAHDGGARSGLAWDVSEQIRSAAPKGTEYRGGLLVPHSLPASLIGARAGLDTATATQGAELKFSQPGPFIEVLRKKAVVLRLGATELEGLKGDVKLPRQTGAGTATFVTQNPGSDVATSNLLLDQASLTPKTIQSTTSYSRQLLALARSSTGIDRLVRSDLAEIHAVAIDAGALQGSGSGANPTGITNTSGVSLVVGGTNGVLPTWANIVELEYQVANANADTNPAGMAYCTSPGIRKRLRLTDRGGTSTGMFILTDGNVISDYPVAVSNNIPQALTKGSSSTCHAIIFGQWSELLLGMWGALEIVTDPYKLKKQGMIELTTFEMVDVTVRHAASFAVMLDALP